MIVNRNIPTGFTLWDIMLGENERDLKGNLVDMKRGYPIGEQGVISAIQGAGKSTFVVQSTEFAIKMGYPCHRVIIIDSDGGSHKLNRLMNLTEMTPEDIEKYYRVYNTNSIEEIVKILEKEHKEYMDQKYTPVTFFDPLRQEKVKMMPYVIVIIDTVTSLKAEAYDVDGKSNILANETDLTTYRLTANLVNSITNFFDKNTSVIWLSHLKDNNPKIGMTIAERDYKSSQNNKKAAIPARLKFKASWSIWFNSINDGANRDAAKHPIQVYSLDDADGESAYSVNYVAAKTRTSTEGRTKGTLIFMNGKFNRSATLIADAINLGLFKNKGIYPTKDAPHIFKDVPDAEYESKIMGSKRKTGLTIDGYDRVTNVLEARLLLNYLGEDPNLIEAQATIYTSMLNSLEHKLAYELEVNCISQEDLDNSNKQLGRMFSYLSKVKRPQVLNVKEANIEKPEPVENVDIL